MDTSKFAMVFNMLTTLTLFVLALVLFFTGHTTGAFFTLIIWVGFSNNNSNSLTRSAISKR